MEFMDLLEEWIELKDRKETTGFGNDHENRINCYARMKELREEINKRMRGDL